ncbi:hypothetical protein Tco_0429353 [Tanacetum coccineum]
MLAPKCATYHGRSTFANPKYLKKAQSDKPRFYEIPYDTSDPANRFCPDGEETVTLEKESRSKLDKDTIKPYNYTYQNSLYETFKPPSKTYLDQLERGTDISQKDEKPSKKATKPDTGWKRADYANLGNFIYKRKKGEKENEKKKDVEGLFFTPSTTPTHPTWPKCQVGNPRAFSIQG